MKKIWSLRRIWNVIKCCISCIQLSVFIRFVVTKNNQMELTNYDTVSPVFVSLPGLTELCVVSELLR